MWRNAAQSLISLNEAPWRWSAGVQAAIATGVPLAVFTAAGHQPRGLIAVLGAFTALYCATLRLSDRVVALPLVGAGFVLASTLAVLCAADAWLTAMCPIGVAVLACAIAFRVDLGPPGPMQFVLVAGISGNIAAPAELGAASVNRLLIPMLVAVGAMSAYLLVIGPLALPFVRQREGKPASFRAVFTLAPFDEETTVIAMRVIAAVAVASVVSLVVCEKGCLGAQAGVGAARHALCRTTRAAQRRAHKALSQATRSRRLWPAAARMALIASPCAPNRRLRSTRPSLFRCPITGSMALRRRSSRRIVGETMPRVCETKIWVGPSSL